jgi:hypothetical protein
MKNDNVAADVRVTVTHESTFDAETERIATLSTEEVRAQLCRMRLAPTQVLPERLQKLLAEARQETQMADTGTYKGLSVDTSAVLSSAVSACGVRGSLTGSQDSDTESNKHYMPPQFGEHILMLLLTKDEHISILGDLTEVYAEIESKYGERYAKLWYYKEVVAWALRLIRNAFRVSLLASFREWIRRSI